MGLPDLSCSHRRARFPFGRRLVLAVLGALAMGSLGAAPAAGAPTWVLPTDLSVAGRNATVPQIAIDAAGEAVAVWRGSDGTNTIIQAAARPPGGAFSPLPDLSLAGGDAFEPQIGITPGGEAIAVWTRFNGANFVIQAAVRPPGGSFSPLPDLAAGQSVTRPQIAINAAGEAIAVWESFNGANTIIQAAVRPPGGIFSPLFALSAAGKSSFLPQIAIGSAGEAVAVWRGSDGISQVIQAAARAPGGAFSPLPDVSAGAPNPSEPRNASEPQIAIGPGGEAVAVWGRSDGTNTIVQAAVRPPGGSFSRSPDLSLAGRDAFAPQIAISRGGEAVAVWQGSSGVNKIIQAAVHPPGGSFSPLPDLSLAGRDATVPQIAIDAAGEAVAVWRRSDGAHTIIQSAARPPGGGSFSLSPDLSAAGQDASAPQIAIDPVGEAAAIWERSNGTNKIIQVAVTAKDTKTALVCKPSPVTVAAAVTCAATVSDMISGSDAPTGTLKLTSDAAGAFAGTCGLTAAGPGNSRCQVTYTPSQVGSGTHTVTAFYLGDGSHVKSDGAAQVTVQGQQRRARSAPDTALKKKPRKKTVRRRAVFRFVADQPGSTFQCKLDRKPFKTCRSPFKAKVKPGRHRFEVRAVNSAGVADPTPAVSRWRVF